MNKQAVTRKRDLLGLISVIIISLFAVLAWWKVQDPQLFPIKIVKVEAPYSNVNRALIKKALLPLVTAGYFTVELEAIKQHLLQLPWIENVIVQRVWPDTLRIQLTESQAVARWNNRGLLVSRQGKLFDPHLTKAVLRLPQFRGPDEQRNTMLDYYYSFNRVLQPLHLEVNELVLTPRRAWQITLNNGIAILLGRAEPLQRLKRFATVYQRLLAERSTQVQAVDLRYANGLSVRWREGVNQSNTEAS